MADHQIGQNRVLPTVVAQAWMKQAAEQVYAPWRCQSISDYRLLKGIVFDGSEPAQCVIELHEQQAGLIEAKIVSYNVQGKLVFHYAGLLQMQRQLDPAPVFSGQLSQTKLKAAQAFYHDGTLFHGPSLQGIEQVMRLDEQGLELQCLIRPESVQQAPGFDLQQSNIFANDLVYQALLVWLSEQKGLSSLPSSTALWRSYQEAPIGQVFSLKLDVVRYKNQQLYADIQLISQQGVVLAEIQSACVTANQQLKALFKHES